MAQISYEGRVIGQPELKFSKAGKAYLRFRTVENSRREIDGKWQDVGAAWRDVTVFGRDAETLAEALNDKAIVTVSGRMDCRDWEKDGRKGTSFEVAAGHVGIVPARQASNGFGQSAASNTFQNAQNPAQGDDPWAPAAPIQGGGFADEPPFLVHE